MIVVEATFYDNANNVINAQHVASDPNILGPGQSERIPSQCQRCWQ